MRRGRDWGSRRLGAGRAQQFFVGLVGYCCQQITAESGQLSILGPNESRTRGIGRQIGYNFNVGGQWIYTNLRGYVEFASFV